MREYQADPGRNLILGDSRLAHIDMDQAARVSGRQWQNLAFGGASLKETLDLATISWIPAIRWMSWC